ncbi:MAG: ammonium transporter [Pseudomonadota bacterium]
MSFDSTSQFAEQVTVNQLAQNVVYASGAMSALFVVVGLLLIDVGGSRRRSGFNSTIEKLVGFFIGFATFFLIGFSVWASQYYVMSGGTMMDSVRDWWAGGVLANSLAQNVDPLVFAGINNYQIFVFFIAAFAGISNVLLHFAVAERMKASAFFITCFFTTIAFSFVAYWTWGSVGPLTNRGFHDFFGVGFVYLLPAGMALVFVPVLGPRPGMFDPHPKVSEYRAVSLGLTVAGLFIIFASLPMVIVACLFFFDPGAYAVSVTMADTSVAIAFNNYGAAWTGGALTGAMIAYKTGKLDYFTMGPMAGYVSGAGGLDVYVPWQMFLVAMTAPLIAYTIYEFMHRRKIDEHKLLPLFIGVGSYGLLMVGLLHGGTPRGGYLGIEEGPYAFQHGEISFVMQLLGVLACIGTGVVTAAILAFILKRTTGLAVSEEDQATGLDKLYWGIEPDVQPSAEKL